MKWLVGAACIAIIASSAVYLGNNYAAFAAAREQQRTAANNAANEARVTAFRDCKIAVLGSAGLGYPGTNIKAVSRAVAEGDRCIVSYPELEDSYPGSALQIVQMRERVRQLRLSETH